MRNSWFRTWLALSILFGCSSVVRAEGKGHSLGEVFRGPGSVGRAASRFENAGRGAPGNPDSGRPANPAAQLPANSSRSLEGLPRSKDSVSRSQDSIGRAQEPNLRTIPRGRTAEPTPRPGELPTRFSTQPPRENPSLERDSREGTTRGDALRDGASPGSVPPSAAPREMPPRETARREMPPQATLNQPLSTGPEQDLERGGDVSHEPALEAPRTDPSSPILDQIQDRADHLRQVGAANGNEHLEEVTEQMEARGQEQYQRRLDRFQNLPAGPFPALSGAAKGDRPAAGLPGLRRNTNVQPGEGEVLETPDVEGAVAAETERFSQAVEQRRENLQRNFDQRLDQARRLRENAVRTGQEKLGELSGRVQDRAASQYQRQERRIERFEQRLGAASDQADRSISNTLQAPTPASEPSGNSPGPIPTPIADNDDAQGPRPTGSFRGARSAEQVPSPSEPGSAATVPSSIPPASPGANGGSPDPNSRFFRDRVDQFQRFRRGAEGDAREQLGQRTQAVENEAREQLESANEAAEGIESRLRNLPIGPSAPPASESRARLAVPRSAARTTPPAVQPETTPSSIPPSIPSTTPPASARSRPAASTPATPPESAPANPAKSKLRSWIPFYPSKTP